MREWIWRVLDQRTEAHMESANAYWSDRSAEDYFERSAIEAARLGNVEGLRALYPNIAEFIHLPRAGRRGKYPRRRNTTVPAIDAAVEDAAFVKLFWREVYGRKNRSRGDNMSAEAIVADYWREMGRTEVTEDAIKQRAKTYRIPALVAKQDADLARDFATSINR
jgi:hypothetical protein